ncbi:MAG: transcriptional regulator [Chitinophagales bacterium]|jgi:DNA-binding transcriptional regulator GbsR (MarR family)|nr:transcriptional regulator [Chitinophagales bacterium]
MNLDEGKQRFIQAWGSFGSKWGINRTMAQVHALLLISPMSLSADNIMDELDISRGNANMNLRALMDWGLVMKEYKPGDRKEYFYAEKDIWRVAIQIIGQRKKRELEPIREILESLMQVEPADAETAAFKKTVADISDLSAAADKMLDKITKSDRNWIMTSFIKMLN